LASAARHDASAPLAGRSVSFHRSSAWPCSLTQWHGDSDTSSNAQASGTRNASLGAAARERGGIGGARLGGEAEAGG